ncbi:hypothetical protein EGW08_013743 [Elysia chlorotica]|uniref:Uncharacterized protein n=1 Tax=Elysia chlorotica TaxID=188477 RepID=A0A433TAA8_ELYCH|nr:hypothetical protein EGW08_013743 [Elysia chlorotica]
MLPKRKKLQVTEGSAVSTTTRGNPTQRNTKRSRSQDAGKNQRTALPNEEKRLKGSLYVYNSEGTVPKQSTVRTRRSSTRLQNQKNSTPGTLFLVDSAYDGDEESSPSATQSEEDDPYSVATMEDVPVVTRERKKKREKHPARAKTTKAKVKKRASSAGGHTSSTPNQIEPPLRRSTRNASHLSSTPEITPILPVKSQDIIHPDLSFATPQINQLSCKQTAISSASPSLQSSSQADSGIALSPPAKRARIQPGAARHKSAILGKKFMNKRNIFSPNSKEKGSESETKENADSSCFGFSCLDSKGLDRQRDMPVSGVYRSAQPVTTDSSPTSPSRPLVSTDSENCLGSHREWPSPSLFSDDMPSADSESMVFNKSSAKSYKPCKERKLKHKKSVSKFEAWANEINMEIEDIEKFVLNIE